MTKHNQLDDEDHNPETIFDEDGNPEEVTYLWLCESEYIIPRPGQLYRYQVNSECEQCKELAKPYFTEEENNG